MFDYFNNMLFKVLRLQEAVSGAVLQITSEHKSYRVGY